MCIRDSGDTGSWVTAPVNAGARLRGGAPDGNQLLEARLAQVDAEPDHETQDDVHDERVSRAPVRDDRASDVSGQQDGAQDRRGRDQVDREARELQDCQRHHHRRGQPQMRHALVQRRPALELHEGAEHEHQRHQARQGPARPHGLATRRHHCLLAATVAASRPAKPFSKSAPIILSMSMNAENALAMKLLWPFIAHVTFVPAPLGAKSNCVVLVAANGFRNSRRMVTLCAGRLAVIVMWPSPTSLLPDQRYSAPVPDGAPPNSRFMAGSSFSQGDHSGHLWKSLT